MRQQAKESPMYHRDHLGDMRCDIKPLQYGWPAPSTEPMVFAYLRDVASILRYLVKDRLRIRDEPYARVSPENQVRTMRDGHVYGRQLEPKRRVLVRRRSWWKLVSPRQKLTVVPDRCQALAKAILPAHVPGAERHVDYASPQRRPLLSIIGPSWADARSVHVEVKHTITVRLVVDIDHSSRM